MSISCLTSPHQAFFAFAVPKDSLKLTAAGFSIANVLFAAANYVDVVGFMPVVWRLYQAENALDDFSVGTTVSLEAKQQERGCREKDRDAYNSIVVYIVKR